MKKEELFEVIGQIDPAEVEKAAKYRGKKKVWRRLTALAACAAVIVAALTLFPIQRGEECKKLMTVMAAYPEPTAKSMSAQQFLEGKKHYEWWSENRKKVERSKVLQPDIYNFCGSLMRNLLPAEDENTVCSPISAYIAFALLAEVTDGNTRQQILDMLGADSIGGVRESVTAIWESSYADTPVLKSLLANSLWLNNDVEYEKDTLDRLAKEYYASSFSGTPGTEEMNEALRRWTDENTGGLLSD